MELREHKLEIGLAFFSALMIIGVFKAFSGYQSRAGITNENISYEMPRPKTDLVGEFGLGDREIERRYLNPYAKKQTKEDPRAPQAANVKAAQSAESQEKKHRKGQWVAVPRPPQVKTEVVEKSDKKTFGNDSIAPNGVGTGAPQLRAAAGGKTPETEAKVDELSPGQWRALLSAQPTRENVDRLLAAHADGKIDADTVHTILVDLMNSRKLENQKLALYGMNRLGDAWSFVYVTKNGDAFPQELQAAAHQFLNSYSQSSRHGALAQLLMSQDVDVVMQASQVILNGLQNGGQVRDPRQLRGEHVSSTPQKFTQFIPIFQDLAMNGDQSVKGMAYQILQLLPGASA